MKRADELLELLERDALPRLQLHTAGDLLNIQRLCTELASARPLSRDDRDVLICVLEDHRLPIGAGRPEGPGDPYQRLLQFAVRVLRIGRQEYLAMYSPRQRDWKSACVPMAEAAIEVVQSDQPGIRITAKEVLDFTEATSDWVRDHVAKHFPDAPELMRERARRLA